MIYDYDDWWDEVTRNYPTPKQLKYIDKLTSQMGVSISLPRTRADALAVLDELKEMNRARRMQNPPPVYDDRRIDD